MNILSHLSFSRLGNLIKLYTSYHIGNLLGKSIQWGKPFSIDFEPTTSCNLRCPECPSGLRKFSRPTGMLQLDLFRKTINELASSSFYLMFYFQGEPFLNEDFLDMVKYAKKKRYYVATSTNAHYLDDDKVNQIIDSGLDRLIISIDGIGQEIYEQYRIGGDYDKVLEGTKRLVDQKRKRKKGPHIIWQFIVFRHNEHQIEAIKKLGKKIGVDEVRIKSAQLYDPEEKVDWMPSNSEYSRYHNQENILPNKCWRLAHATVVTWDGKVLPCCYDKDASHQMGELTNQSFDKIWKDQSYQNFRKSIKENRSQHEICRNCGEGVKVWRS